MRRRSAAFTLVEVLIALLIIAIALAAAIRATNESVRATIHVRNTVAAHWVGLNILSEIQTGLLQSPTLGDSSSGKTTMLNQTWDWTVTTNSREGSSGIIQVVVTVSLRNHVINTVTGYIE